MWISTPRRSAYVVSGDKLLKHRNKQRSANCNAEDGLVNSSSSLL